MGGSRTILLSYTGFGVESGRPRGEGGIIYRIFGRFACRSSCVRLDELHPSCILYLHSVVHSLVLQLCTFSLVLQLCTWLILEHVLRLSGVLIQVYWYVQELVHKYASYHMSSIKTCMILYTSKRSKLGVLSVCHTSIARVLQTFAVQNI